MPPTLTHVDQRLQRAPALGLVRSAALTLLLCIGLPATAAPQADAIATPQADASATPLARVDTVAHTLAAAYDPATGLFRGTGWWNSANGITALADAARALHTARFDPMFANTFTAAQRAAPGFLNPFYDDEGWWALAWLDVYRLHPDPRYLHMAATIFEDMKGGWSDVCGGGIWWKKDVHYKNAIANELFLAVAVQLATANQGSARSVYLDWAQREKTWFLGSGLINSRSLVNDGLTGDCKNNGKTTWTYNQGVLVGALSGLYALTPDPATLSQASRIANAAAADLADQNGVLHDPCEPDCGADAVQFKGILARNFTPLLLLAPSSAIRHMLDESANSAWIHARMPNGSFACGWSGPAADGKTGALISVLDIFTADLPPTATANPA